MTVPRPYEITVYNRANEEQVGRYVANDPPRVGEIISFFSQETSDGDPFHLWGTWRVDSVLWRVSARGSTNAMGLYRETVGQISEAVCYHIDVMVWPEEGPFWAKTPPWSKLLASAGYRDDDALPDDQDE